MTDGPRGWLAGWVVQVARGLSSVVDTLVTHPNVMNGASLYWPALADGSGGGGRVLYTEGYALDAFASGRWGLSALRQGGHRIGLVLDQAMEPDMRTRHLQVSSHPTPTDRQTGLLLR